MTTAAPSLLIDSATGSGEIVAYKVVVDGQTFDLPAEYAADVKLVRAVLTPFYPGAADATITRTSKDGVMTITITKQAGRKGAAPSAQDTLTALLDCPAGENPAVVAYRELLAIDPDSTGLEELASLDNMIDEAVSSGRRQKQDMNAALKRLMVSRAQVSPVIPFGF